MHKCTEHTRRVLNPEVRCCACDLPLVPGERYRKRVIADEEYWSERFSVHVAHSLCVLGNEWWILWGS